MTTPAHSHRWARVAALCAGAAMLADNAFDEDAYTEEFHEQWSVRAFAYPDGRLAYEVTREKK